MTTASSILVRATARLNASPHLRETAARDALTLLLHTLGIGRAEFYAHPDREITSGQQTAYQAAIVRRLANEPIQYITGEQEFFGLALRVTPAVLIPRPETEFLVEAVLGELAGLRGPRIVDVGTGSGAIAIALAHRLPDAHITATDISPAALAVARENAARHSLADRIRFVEADLLDALTEGRDRREAGAARDAGGGRFDAVVSNPPYVPEPDRAALHPQVGDYEPAAALFAGEDGLAIYRRLIPQARAALVPNGLLALEIGHGQRGAVAELLADWNGVSFVDDLRGIPRVALARRA